MTVRIGHHDFDNVSYDAHGDVLYLSARAPTKADAGDGTPEGHFVRFNGEGAVVGVTLVKRPLADRPRRQTGGHAPWRKHRRARHRGAGAGAVVGRSLVRAPSTVRHHRAAWPLARWSTTKASRSVRRN